MGQRGVLKITTEGIGLRDRIEIAVKPKDVQNGGIGPDRDSHATILDAPQRHH
ncbi:MAG: hypothetical protein JWO66_2271 [Candidatus Eremiobacteraeota bacterium]|jgi:hypothetical protein|nr:hypothetical protein [Candidatus Eremiobacteraeota bacterium]